MRHTYTTILFESNERQTSNNKKKCEKTHNLLINILQLLFLVKISKIIRVFKFKTVWSSPGQFKLIKKKFKSVVWFASRFVMRVLSWSSLKAKIHRGA